jgi:hypothetical protein
MIGGEEEEGKGEGIEEIEGEDVRVKEGQSNFCCTARTTTCPCTP